MSLSHDLQLVEDLATGLWWVEERLTITGTEPWRPCSPPGTHDEAEAVLGRFLCRTLARGVPAPEIGDDPHA